MKKVKEEKVKQRMEMAVQRMWTLERTLDFIRRNAENAADSKLMADILSILHSYSKVVLIDLADIKELVFFG
jgi:hypothetical protein